MLIIARHGHSGTSPYASIKGFLRAAEHGADIAQISVRLTEDSKLVLAGASRLNNSKLEPVIRKSSLKELRRHTAGSKSPIELLDDALKQLYGRIMLAIELNEHGAIVPLLEGLKPYLKRKRDWEKILFCSSNPLILRKLRRAAPDSNLVLIHSRHTPLAFLAWHPTLQLSALFIHRLSVSSLVIEAAHRLELPVCAYTVDRKKAAEHLEELGVDAIVTDFPEKF